MHWFGFHKYWFMPNHSRVGENSLLSGWITNTWRLFLSVYWSCVWRLMLPWSLYQVNSIMKVSLESLCTLYHDVTACCITGQWCIDHKLSYKYICVELFNAFTQPYMKTYRYTYSFILFTLIFMYYYHLFLRLVATGGVEPPSGVS